jgi:hypothetical protein
VAGLIRGGWWGVGCFFGVSSWSLRGVLHLLKIQQCLTFQA